jgi:hypothetical protein
VGGSLTIPTSGEGNNVAQGWGRVVTSASIAGTTIFREGLMSSGDSEGAVPLSLNNLTRFLLPFDNTQGFATAMALANTDPALSATVSVMLRDPSGNVLGNHTLNLGPLTRMAFGFSDQFQETMNAAGVAEFSSSVPLSTLGLRFSPLGSFTSLLPLGK